MNEPCCPDYQAMPPGPGGAIIESHSTHCPTLPPPGWDDRGEWPPTDPEVAAEWLPIHAEWLAMA